MFENAVRPMTVWGLNFPSLSKIGGARVRHTPAPPLDPALGIRILYSTT